MRVKLSCEHAENACYECRRSVKLAALALQDEANKVQNARTAHYRTRIPAADREAIARLAHAGTTKAAIARALNISQQTVARYFPRDARCPCGALMVEHPGYCPIRYPEADRKRAEKEAVPRKYRRSGEVF